MLDDLGTRDAMPPQVIGSPVTSVTEGGVPAPSTRPISENDGDTVAHLVEEPLPSM
jgi:hypothetical protein